MNVSENFYRMLDQERQKESQIISKQLGTTKQLSFMELTEIIAKRSGIKRSPISFSGGIRREQKRRRI